MRFEVEAPIAKRGVNWRLLAIDALLLLSIGFSSGWHLRLVPMFVVLGLAALAVSGAVRTPKRPGKKRRKVSADAAGLSVDGAVLMERAAIRSAYCVPAEGGRHAVHVEGEALRQACTVYVDSAQEGEALLAALQIDPTESIAHFRALPPWAKHLRWLAVLLTASPWVLINVLRLVPAWGLGVIVALYGVVLLPTLLPQHVEVGHDGVFLQWLGNRRFIPFSNIESVVETRIGVELLLHGDRQVEIRLSQKDGAADAKVKALTARIESGIAAYAGVARVDEEAFLARSGRDLETWMREMRTLGAGEMGGYRAAAIPRERLWAVVENPAADASAREGAALALTASLDAADRARLAALAHKTAQPRLRVALDLVSREHEEVRLRVALESAESEVEEPVSGASPAARAATARRGR